MYYRRPKQPALDIQKKKKKKKKYSYNITNSRMTLLSIFKSGNSSTPEPKDSQIIIKSSMNNINVNKKKVETSHNIGIIPNKEKKHTQDHKCEDRSVKNPLSKLSLALKESALLPNDAEDVEGQSYHSFQSEEECWCDEEPSDDNVSVLLPNFAAAAGIDDEYKDNVQDINNSNPINIMHNDDNDIDETKNIYFRKNSVDLDYEFSSSDDDYVYENEKVKNMMRHEESPEEYVKGGYHPAKKNEYFYRRKYRLIQKLGWGHFSTVWLAKDLTVAYDDKNKYIALKIVKASPSSSEAAKDETDILIELAKAEDNAIHSGKDYIIKLLSAFYHTGPNGIHTCMAFELLGENLLKLSERNEKRRLPMVYVKQIAKQLLLALDFLHRKCGIIHTDIKPENILMEIGDLETITEMIKLQKIQKRKLKCMPCRKRSDAKSRSNSKVNNISTTESTCPCDDVKNNTNDISALEPFEDEADVNPTVKAPEENMESDNAEGPSIFKTMKSSLSYLLQQQASQKHRKRSLVSYSMPLPSVLSAKQYYNQTQDQASDESEMLSRSIKDILHPIPNLESNIIKIKIGDMGNGCWIDYHFSSEIQTREYRSPEAIVGYKWGCAVDIWSVACLVFELLTGDVLFSPQSGKSYSKEDDHMAQIEELLGEVPVKLKTKGKYSRALYRRNGKLRNIGGLRPWNLFEVFTQKYGIEDTLATELTEFLLPMLEIDPSKRADAGGMVNHPWLNDALGMEDVVVKDRPLAGGSGMDLPGWDDIAQVIRDPNHCLYRKDEEMNFKNI